MAKNILINSITLRYSPEEDRLLLKCQSESAVHQVWWTQRLWQRVFPVLIDWLDKQMSNVDKETSNFYQTLAQQQADEALVKDSQRATNDQNVIDQQHQTSEVKEVEVPSSATALCAKIEFAFQKHALKMMMFSLNEGVQFDVQMSIKQLRQFMLAQSRCLQRSDWPQNTPSWLLPESNQSKTLGTSLH